MKVCGLTGGVGMGKSTAASFFQQAGAAVVDTDEVARDLTQPGQPALAEIQSAFGPQFVGPDGRLRRPELARLVFADAVARRKLEAILHPRIRERWVAQVECCRRQSRSLAVVVIPLLFETQAETQFDQIVCAACSAATQRERLLTRGWMPEQITGCLAAQLPAEEKIARSHFVIWTEGALDLCARQVGQILGRLQKM